MIASSWSGPRLHALPAPTARTASRRSFLEAREALLDRDAADAVRRQLEGKEIERLREDGRPLPRLGREEPGEVQQARQGHRETDRAHRGPSGPASIRPASGGWSCTTGTVTPRSPCGSPATRSRRRTAAQALHHRPAGGGAERSDRHPGRQRGRQVDAARPWPAPSIPSRSTMTARLRSGSILRAGWSISTSAWPTCR